MASLTRGISFRRQGSSGMSWTDTWSFNEEGVLVRTMREESHMHQQRFGGSSLARIHDSHDDDDDDGNGGGGGGGAASGPNASLEAHGKDILGAGAGAEEAKKKAEPSSHAVAPAGLRRSKSVGSAPAAAAASAAASGSTKSAQKSASRILKWLKKTFGKRKSRA